MNLPGDGDNYNIKGLQNYYRFLLTNLTPHDHP